MRYNVLGTYEFGTIIQAHDWRHDLLMDIFVNKPDTWPEWMRLDESDVEPLPWGIEDPDATKEPEKVYSTIPWVYGSEPVSEEELAAMQADINADYYRE